MSRLGIKCIILFPVGLLFIYIVLHFAISSGFHQSHQNATNQFSRKTSVIGKDGQTLDYDRNSKIVFIGGVPRSGLSLARAILEAHQGLHCREESIVMPKVLQMRSQWKKSAKESLRLEEAGMSAPVLDSAFSALLLVLQPKLMIKKLYQFLHLSINKEEEKRMLKILDSLTSEDLTKWVGDISSEVLDNLATKCPIMKKLGYDPSDSAPDYNKLRT